MNELPLGLSPKSEFAEETGFHEILSAFESEPLDHIVQSLAIEREIPMEEAEECKASFLRFLALAKWTETSMAPDRKGDAFWHTFLTHTRDYAAFCDKHFGSFVHHDRPMEPKATDEAPAVISKLMWDHFERVADCNNTCHADWAKQR